MGAASFQSLFFYSGFGVPTDLTTTLEDLSLDMTNTENNEFTVGEKLYNTTFTPTGIVVGEYKGTFTETGGNEFLVILTAGNVYALYSTEPVATSNFPATFDGTGVVEETYPACFAEGTEISTPCGTRAVETLRVGDPILTADGKVVAVKWLGRQTVSTKFRAADRLMPVRICAGALGDGVPHRDLVLTADHALLLDDMLINAGALVNGSTIDTVPPQEMGEKFTVYHVETENHDVILAEGAVSETFVDYAARSCFDNYDEYVALYGEDHMIPEMPQARISSARLLPEALKARLGIADGAAMRDVA